MNGLISDLQNLLSLFMRVNIKLYYLSYLTVDGLDNNYLYMYIYVYLYEFSLSDIINL